jgi:hypothetical protein
VVVTQVPPLASFLAPAAAILSFALFRFIPGTVLRVSPT